MQDDDVEDTVDAIANVEIPDSSVIKICEALYHCWSKGIEVGVRMNFSDHEHCLSIVDVHYWFPKTEVRKETHSNELSLHPLQQKFSEERDHR